MINLHHKLRLLTPAPRMELVGYSTAGNENDSITLNKPVGTVEGDLLLGFFYHDRASSTATLTGWSVAGSIGDLAGSVNLLYKVAGASEGSSYTFVFGGIPRPNTAAIITLRGGTEVVTPGMVHNDLKVTVLSIPSLTVEDNSIWLAYTAYYAPSNEATATPNGATILFSETPFTEWWHTLAYMESNAATISGLNWTLSTTEAQNIIVTAVSPAE